LLLIEYKDFKKEIPDAVKGKKQHPVLIYNNVCSLGTIYRTTKN